MKIEIKPSTYIISILFFLSGYFEYIYLFLLIIFIHESGHYFFSKIIHFKSNKIIIYPFGGLTLYNEDLNINTNKELFVLIGGITFQLLFWLFIIILYNNGYVLYKEYNIINRINYILISFNFMPIIPLDGGRLINILLDKIFPYKLSLKISIIISMITILYYGLSYRTVLSIILLFYLIKSIYFEIINIDSKYYRFLFERYINKYNFKKIKYIKNINNLYRDYYHIINGIREDKVILNIFDRK